MSIDQALRKARSLPPEAAAALYREMLKRFPANQRIRAELDALLRPAIVAPPVDALDQIVALYSAGRAREALDAARALLDHFEASEILHNITGAILAALGDFAGAIAHYDRALVLAPDYFEAYNNRGNALNDDARPAEAVASFDRAIALHPDYAEAFVNRGVALKRLRRLDEAFASGSQAIRLNPASAAAYNNRGSTLAALNRWRAALADFEQAIALHARYADAYVNRGIALKAIEQPEAAVASYDQALAIAPRHFRAHTHRATALRDLKRLDEARDGYRRALAIAPGSALAASGARTIEAHMCLWSAARDTPVALGTGEDAFPPFAMLAFEDDPQRQLEAARHWSAKEFGGAPAAPRPAPRRGERIRIGYFSADFQEHATMYLMARLFELHDRDRFEIHAFSYGPDIEDAMRQRLRGAVDDFHPIRDLGEEAAAALARRQSIDIAIDLKGHTRDTRSGIFAHRAAPVQVNYLGYPGTMGAEFIDYIIADRFTIPAGQQRHYSETVAYLPHCYQPNDDTRAISPRVFTRADLGLPDGFVFCCFNNNYKITPAEFDIWMRLLTQVDGSVLWLLADNRWAADNLRREAEARGVSGDRLVFAGRVPVAEHLARHRHADLFLDTFAVNAHTTASDALWAGVPVLTQSGSSFVARVAGSLLHAVGLPDLVTETAADYERVALALATDRTALADVKARLERNRRTTPLFDTAGYTRDLEALYERLISAAPSAPSR